MARPLRSSAFWIALGVACAGWSRGQEALPLDAWTRYPKASGSSALPQPIDYPLHRRAGLDAPTIRDQAARDPAGLARALREQLRDARRNSEVLFVPGAPTWVGAREHARTTLRLLSRLGLIDSSEAEDRGLALLRAGTDASLEALIVNYPDSSQLSDAHRILAERHFERGSWAAAELTWRTGSEPRPALATNLSYLRRRSLSIAPQRLAVGWIRTFRRSQGPPHAACLTARHALLSRAQLHAIERDTGRLAWRLPLPPGLLSAGPDAALHASGAKLTCVDVQTGAEEWGLDLSRSAAAEVRALVDAPQGWVALVFEVGNYELVGIDRRGSVLYRTRLWAGDPARRSRVARWGARRARRQEALFSKGDGQLLRVGSSVFLTAEGFVARAHSRTGELLWVRDRAFGAPLPAAYAHPVQLGTDGRELWASTAGNLLQHLDPLDGDSRPLPAYDDRLVLACGPLLTARFSEGRLHVFADSAAPLADLPPEGVVGRGQISGRLLVLPGTTGVSWVDWLAGRSGQLELPDVFPRALTTGRRGEVLVWGVGGVALVRGAGPDLAPPAPASELPEGSKVSGSTLRDVPALVAALDAPAWRLRERAFRALRSAPGVDATLRAALEVPHGPNASADLELLLELRGVRRAWDALAPSASPDALDRIAFSPHLVRPELPPLTDSPQLADLRSAIAALPACSARRALLARSVTIAPELRASLLALLEAHDVQPGLARAAADLWVETLTHDLGESVRASVVERGSTRALALLYGVALERSPRERHALHADPNQWNAATHLAQLHFPRLPRATVAERREVERRLLTTEVPNDR